MTTRLRRSGPLPYLRVLESMRHFTEHRRADTPDELWQLQHLPVFTQGQAGKPEHLLNPGDIPVIQTDRGGQVTYHGPGQLVTYFLLDLKRRGLGVRQMVDLLEQSLIAVLADLGIPSSARSDAPGVYVGDCKIASLGLRIRRGCSFHGFALNVGMNLEPFERINPCGLAGIRMAQVQDYRPDMRLEQVAELWRDHYVRATADVLEEAELEQVLLPEEKLENP